MGGYSNKLMPKLNEVIQYYKDRGWPIKCVYCGSENDLTKDHIHPKCRVPQYVRLKMWRKKERNPDAYYKQFAICCKYCNQMKGAMTHNEFLEQIKKIIVFLKLN